MEALAKETIESIEDQIATVDDPELKAKLVREVRRLKSNARLKAMLELARSEPGIPVLPRQLDTDPEKLNVQNGTIDLRTGELLPHNPGDLITKLAPVRYNPAARSGCFDGFLARVLPDVEVRHFLKRVAGYSLLGHNPEEIVLFIYGPPASGKSTFLRAMSSALGEYAFRSDRTPIPVQTVH